MRPSEQEEEEEEGPPEVVRTCVSKMAISAIVDNVSVVVTPPPAAAVAALEARSSQSPPPPAAPTVDDDDDNDDDKSGGSRKSSRRHKEEEAAAATDEFGVPKHKRVRTAPLALPLTTRLRGDGSESSLRLDDAEVRRIVREARLRIGEGRLCHAFAVNTAAGDVAVKLWRSQRRVSPEDIGRLRSEARALRDCRSANVLAVFGYFDLAPCVCLVTELCAHGTLAAYAEARPVNLLRHAKCFATNIENALRCVHARGFVHRDVKPENLFLRSDGDLKQLVLGDFGHATRKEEAQKGVLGTDAWAAPELLQRVSPATEASDIFSFGLVLHFMLNPSTALDRLSHTGYPAADAWSPRWQCLVRACLSQRPDKRPTHDKILSYISVLPEHPTSW